MSTPGNRRVSSLSERATRTDRRLKGVAGILILLIGGAIAYSMIFTGFDQRVTFQWEFENGERTPITHVACPSPWAVMAADAQPEGVVSGDLCVKPARGQLILGISTAVGALVLATWIFTRDTQRGPLPELPESVRALLRKR